MTEQLSLLRMALQSPHVALTCPRPAARKDSLFKHSNEIRVSANDFQAKSKHKQLKITRTLSRRDALSSFSGALLATFSAINSAEARTVKPETKRKIREKLDKLREKGGVPKEKKEPSTGEQEKPPASPSSSLTMPLVEANF